VSGVGAPMRGGAHVLPPATLIRKAAIYALIAALGAGVVTQFLPRVYQAGIKILPSDAPAGLPFADLMAGTDLSALLGARGSAQNPVLTYPEILLSRPVLEKTLDLQVDSISSLHAGHSVIDALRIRGKTPSIRYDRGIRKLRKLIAVRPNLRSGIIAITVDTNDPGLSAFVANGLVRNLNEFNLQVRETRSRAVREFIQGRLAEAAAALSRSEQDLAHFRASNIRIGGSAQLALEQDRLQREAEIQAELYRLLQRQFEQAQIEEHRDTPTFTVMESALPPVKKHRPSMILNMVSAAAACIVLLVVVEFVLPRMAPRGAPAENP